MRIMRDMRILGACNTLIASDPRTVLSNPFRPDQGTLTEWTLTDGDDTPLGAVRFETTDTEATITRRMARVARNYWKA